MNEYLNGVNSGFFYLIVALVLGFVVAMCFVFLIKSYKAGIAIGMDERVQEPFGEFVVTYSKDYAVSVQLEPVPATTGILPFTTLIQ